jgi:hypothetical protein
MDIARNVVDNHQDELNILDKQLSTWQKLISRYLYTSEKIKEIIKDSKVLTYLNTELKNIVGKIGLSFNKILENVLNLDKTLTDFGKSVQISKDGARILADNFEEVSFNAKNINSNVSSTMASIKGQIEANNQLNQSLGTGALFTAQTRLDQIELTRGMGLQAETAAKLYQLGSLNQKTAHQTAVDIGDQVVNFRKSTGITLDYRKVLDDVSKISGQLSVQYKNNPILIAKAVLQTKQLGIELGQAASMADKLLEFEYSIQSELEAELLTGKALNLEIARELALRGDVAGSAKEMLTQVGSLAEFQELNVLQQRSLAKAIGLGVDELSNALVQQEQLKGTSYQTAQAFEEAARQAARTGDYTKINAELAQASNGEELASQAAQISNQEKLQMAIEKLQETIANMVNGPFGTLIDKFTTLISKAWVLKGIVGTIGAYMAINWVKSMYSFGAAIARQIPFMASLAAEATFVNAALTLGAGVVAAGIAAAVGIAAINAASEGQANIPTPSGGGGVKVPSTNRMSADRNSSQNISIDNKIYLGGKEIANFNNAQQSQQTGLA